MFKKNVGILDRIVRVTLGTLFLPSGLFLLRGLQGNVLGLVFIGLGVIGLVTGISGICPTYVLIGIDTREKERELMTRCMSMMAGFRQGAGGVAGSDGEQMFGRCAPFLRKDQEQQGETR